jgi:hypothetical protein
MTETSPNTSPDVSAAAPAGTAEPLTAEPLTAARSPEPPPSFVKLAMRNMVRKGRQSLLHFGLTAVGFIGFILLVAWFGRPTLPQ